MQCINCGTQLYENQMQCPNCGYMHQQNYMQGMAGNQMPNDQVQNTYVQNVQHQNQYAQNQFQQHQFQQNQYAQQANYYGQQQYNGMGYLPPMSIKEFEQLPLIKKFCKDIRVSAIVLYICAGFNLILAHMSGSMYTLIAGIIDLAILVGLALGMHLARNFVCALLNLIYISLGCLVNSVFNGRLTGWLPLFVAIYAVQATYKYSKIKKQFKQSGKLAK